MQSLPNTICSLYGSWSEAATQQLQMEKIPGDMLHALNAGRNQDNHDEDLRWALSVRHNIPLTIAYEFEHHR